jgi:hypothetical protein
MSDIDHLLDHAAADNRAGHRQPASSTVSFASGWRCGGLSAFSTESHFVIVVS